MKLLRMCRPSSWKKKNASASKNKVSLQKYISIGNKTLSQKASPHAVWHFSIIDSALVIILLLTATLRFIALDRQSLWADELFAVFWSRTGIVEMLRHCTEETNPPLYYIILNRWAAAFGGSEVAYRLLSAFASFLTIPVIYELSRMCFGVRAALISCVMFSMSATQLYYAQEARGYAIIGFLFALSLMSAARLIDQLSKVPSVTKFSTICFGLIFVLTSALLAYVHFVGFMIVASLGMSILVISALADSATRGTLGCVIVLGAVIGILVLPALVLALAQRGSSNLSWMTYPSLTKFVGLLAGAPSWAGIPDGLYGGVIIFAIITASAWLVLLLYGVLRFWHSPVNALVYVAPVIGITLLSSVSFYQPFLFTRTVLWMSIPIYVGLGGSVTALRRDAQQVAAAIVLVLGCLPFTLGYFTYAVKEPWKEITHSYASKLEPGDLVILGSDTPAMAFAYYSKGFPLDQLRRWPASVTVADRLDERVTKIRPIDDASISDVVRSGHRAWFLSRGCDVPTSVNHADVTLLFRCENPIPSGLGLIRLFLYEILGKSDMHR